MRILGTPLCTLEPQSAAHAQEMFAVLSDPAIYEFENAPPRSLAWLAERFAKLETRCSPDGSEAWLNWVVRLPGGELAGYVQATVPASGVAHVAYEFASRYWGRGLARSAVQAMLDELVAHHDARSFVAVLKARNHRSLVLLHRLGFVPASPADVGAGEAEPDERVMARRLPPEASFSSITSI